MINWIVRNRTGIFDVETVYLCWTEFLEIEPVFDIYTVYLCLTELFKIKLFLHLTQYKQNYTYIKLNCLK